MNNAVSDSNKSKLSNIREDSNLFRSRREATRRRDQEDIVEASSVGGAVKRSGNIISRSTKGFLGRIFDFVGTLMIGWIINNVPTIINLAQDITKKAQKLFGILSDGFSGFQDILSGFGEVLSGIYSNVISFDFDDSQGKVKDGFDKINKGFDKIDLSFRKTIDLFSRNLDRLFDFDTNVGGLPLPSDKDVTPGSGGRVSGGSSDFWLLSLISLYENSNSQGAVDVAQSIYNRMGYSGRTAREEILAKNQYEPVGKFGRASEWAKVVDRDSAIAHIKKYPGNGASASGLDRVASSLLNKSMQEKAAKFVGNRPDFRSESYENQNDEMTKDSTRHGQTFGFNRGSAYLGRSDSPAGVPDLGASLLTGPQLENVKLSVGTVLTDKIGRGVEYIEITDVIGSSREGGKRLHGGIDIGAPSGTYISLRVDCEVVGFKSAQSGGKYGNVIDVWVPTYGVQLRIAHCKDLLITSGKIAAETSFATVGRTGSADGPHIHLEYTKEKGRMSGGSDADPSPFVGLLLLTNGRIQAVATSTTTNKTSTIAQINIEDVRKRDPQALRKNRTANVIAVQAPQPPQQVESAPIMMGGESFIISTGNDANDFITKKLLLDLAYT